MQAGLGDPLHPLTPPPSSPGPAPGAHLVAVVHVQQEPGLPRLLEPPALALLGPAGEDTGSQHQAETWGSVCTIGLVASACPGQCPGSQCPGGSGGPPARGHRHGARPRVRRGCTRSTCHSLGGCGVPAGRPAVGDLPSDRPSAGDRGTSRGSTGPPRPPRDHRPGVQPSTPQSPRLSPTEVVQGQLGTRGLGWQGLGRGRGRRLPEPLSLLFLPFLLQLPLQDPLLLRGQLHL